MKKDHEHRRRRALYRATHRGAKEMDWLLGRYAAVKTPQMNLDELAAFEALLARTDPEIESWILRSVPVESEFADLIFALRRFHGL